jgi:hypothetical protein
MRKVLIIVLLPLLFTGCKKNGENIVWERTYGTGKAFFVKNLADTAIVACGESEGKQYLLLTDRNGNKIAEYKPDISGVLTSAYAGSDYIMASGSSDGKLSLVKLDLAGTPVWDTVFTSALTVEYASMVYAEGGNFLAVGSADPDSALKDNTAFYFKWFDSGGNINSEKELVFTGSFAAARGVSMDNSGNIYLAVTRKGSSGKLKATVVKYNSDLQKLWEKELYNNPLFGAASMAITIDPDNNPVITGRTEMQVSKGIANNAFAARYFFAGDSLQKCYLEYTNTGTSVTGENGGDFLVLNTGCLVVSILGERLKSTGLIRTFSSCDPQTTDTFGYSLDITGEGNIIMAGNKGSQIYIAVKSSSSVSPI